MLSSSIIKCQNLEKPQHELIVSDKLHVLIPYMRRISPNEYQDRGM
jgi:hypothetical protein